MDEFWTFDQANGNMWQYITGGGSATNHNLADGDRIMFITDGGGAEPYAINTIYYVELVTGSTTEVYLRASKTDSILEGIPVLEGEEGPGNWSAVLFESSININTDSLLTINTDNILSLIHI